LITENVDYIPSYYSGSPRRQSPNTEAA